MVQIAVLLIAVSDTMLSS